MEAVQALFLANCLEIKRWRKQESRNITVIKLKVPNPEDHACCGLQYILQHGISTLHTAFLKCISAFRPSLTPLRGRSSCWEDEQRSHVIMQVVFTYFAENQRIPFPYFSSSTMPRQEFISIANYMIYGSLELLERQSPGRNVKCILYHGQEELKLSLLCPFHKVHQHVARGLVFVVM